MGDAAARAQSSQGGIYETGEYLAKNETWHAEGSPFKADQIARILDRNNLEPRSFVEVGCGAGAILAELSDRYPVSVFDGYDISPQASMLNAPRETDRVRFHHADFLSSTGHYDVLLCIDVFEHVPDYLGFLNALPNRADYAIFHVPMEINLLSILRRNMLNSRVQWGHLHYFNRDTAIATLKDCGYEIVDDFYTEIFLRMPRASLKNKITGMVYRAVFWWSKDIAVKLFGDCSLLLLARPALPVT